MQTETRYIQVTSIPNIDTELITPAMLDLPNFLLENINLVNSLTEKGNTIDLYSIDRSQRSNPESPKFYILKELRLPVGATLVLSETDFPAFNDNSRIWYLHINSDLEPQGTIDADITFTINESI
tara:strand:- start:236 stop:610 length:375 start_codon:yes stop_codon:yes gene_type:complete